MRKLKTKLGRGRSIAVIGLVFTTWSLSACAPNSTQASGPEPSDVSTSQSTSPNQEGGASPSTSSNAPETEEAFPYDVYEIGETVKEFNMELTIKSVDVVDGVKTVDGVPITAAEGRDLVLVDAVFVNTGSKSVDLSCSGLNDAFIEGFDIDNNQMEEVFEGYRIKGNPDCNASLLNGEKSSWKFLYEMKSGSKPGYLTVTDTRTFDDMYVVSFIPNQKFDLTN